MENNIFKAKKGTPEYDEWLRQYREKRGSKQEDSASAKNVLSSKSESIQKQLKAEGISVPPSFKTNGKVLSFSSDSNRAERTLVDLSSNLKRAGWKRLNTTHDEHPDGSNHSLKETFISPDGKTVYQHSLRYNGPYYASFLSTADKEQQIYDKDFSDYVESNTPFNSYQLTLDGNGKSTVNLPQLYVDHYKKKLTERGFIRNANDKFVGPGVTCQFDGNKVTITADAVKRKKLA